MATPTNKQELLTAIADGYAKLCEQIAKMSDDEKVAPFDFAADPKKCGVRWEYDRCLRDLLIHLHEWQVLMREFVQNIREGHPRDYLPDEYRRNYHEMDKMLVEKHQVTPLEEAARLLQQTQDEMLSLADSFTEEELFKKGYYKNTYNNGSLFCERHHQPLRSSGETAQDPPEEFPENREIVDTLPAGVWEHPLEQIEYTKFQSNEKHPISTLDTAVGAAVRRLCAAQPERRCELR